MFVFIWFWIHFTTQNKKCIVGMICFPFYSSFLNSMLIYFQWNLFNCYLFNRSCSAHAIVIHQAQEFRETFTAWIGMMVSVYNTIYHQPHNELYLYICAHTYTTLQVRVKMSNCLCWSRWNSAQSSLCQHYLHKINSKIIHTKKKSKIKSSCFMVITE